MCVCVLGDLLHRVREGSRQELPSLQTGKEEGNEVFFKMGVKGRCTSHFLALHISPWQREEEGKRPGS